MSVKFKRFIYCNKHNFRVSTQNVDSNNPIKIRLDSPFQVLKILFALAFNGADDDASENERNIHEMYFLPKVETNNYVFIFVYDDLKTLIN